MRGNYLRNKGKLSCNRIFFAGAVMHSTLINSVVMGTAGRMNATAHAAANHFEMMGTRFSSSSFFFSRYPPRLVWHSGLTNSDVRTAVSTNINYIRTYVLMYMHLCRAFRYATNTITETTSDFSLCWFSSKIMTPRTMTIASHDAPKRSSRYIIIRWQMGRSRKRNLP